jgi:hypothetical protein
MTSHDNALGWIGRDQDKGAQARGDKIFIRLMIQRANMNTSGDKRRAPRKAAAN